MTRALLFAIASTLAACADPHAHLSPDFGNSVSANIAAQVVNPAPNLGNEPASSNGSRAGDAYSRYVKGRVYQPVPAIQTLKGGDVPPPLPQAN